MGKRYISIDTYINCCNQALHQNHSNTIRLASQTCLSLLNSAPSPDLSSNNHTFSSKLPSECLQPTSTDRVPRTPLDRALSQTKSKRLPRRASRRACQRVSTPLAATPTANLQARPTLLTMARTRSCPRRSRRSFLSQLSELSPTLSTTLETSKHILQ